MRTTPLEEAHRSSHKDENERISQSSRWIGRLGFQSHLLKQLPRTGWLVRGVSCVESIASHSYGVALWTLWLAERAEQRGEGAIDLGKALSIAILHDLPEAATGDLMPSQKAMLFGDDPRVQKQSMLAAEQRYWKRLQEGPQNSSNSSNSEPTVSSATDKPTDWRRFHSALFARWERVWREYREAQTLEAKLVKQADALDCVLQAVSYRGQWGVSLEDFVHLVTQASRGDDELQAMLLALWEESSTRQDYEPL